MLLKSSNKQTRCTHFSRVWYVHAEEVYNNDFCVSVHSISASFPIYGFGSSDAAESQLSQISCSSSGITRAAMTQAQPTMNEIPCSQSCRLICKTGSYTQIQVIIRLISKYSSLLRVFTTTFLHYYRGS